MTSKIIKHYSSAFKRKVVSEIEDGRLTIGQAQQLYGIKGGQTIQNWLKNHGKAQLLSKVVRIETTDEVNQLKVMVQQNHRLESALAQAHLKIVGLESILEKASQVYGEDIKKKFATSALGN